MESVVCNESFSELVRSGEVAALNRVKESSLLLSADNFCGCDLLAEDDLRAARFDEPHELRPEVPFVFFRLAFPSTRERLAWATSGPDRAVGRPSSKTQSVVPSPDSCEEVATSEPNNVICRDMLDAPLVNLPASDQPMSDQLT